MSLPLRLSTLAALGLPCALAACAPKAETAGSAPVTLDCAIPFDVQSAKIIAQPHLLPASHAPGEPYFFYSTENGRASYLITEKGAPGHPAIMMQTAGGGEVKTVGCAYGDKKSYNQLLAYLDSLKAWTRR